MLAEMSKFSDGQIEIEHPTLLEKQPGEYTWLYKKKRRESHEICLGLNLFDEDAPIFTFESMVWDDPAPDEARRTIEWVRAKDSIARDSLESLWVYDTVGEEGRRYNWYSLFRLQRRWVFFEVLRSGHEFDAESERAVWCRCAKSLRRCKQ